MGNTCNKTSSNNLKSSHERKNYETNVMEQLKNNNYDVFKYENNYYLNLTRKQFKLNSCVIKEFSDENDFSGLNKK